MFCFHQNSAQARQILRHEAEFCRKFDQISRTISHNNYFRDFDESNITNACILNTISEKSVEIPWDLFANLRNNRPKNRTLYCLHLVIFVIKSQAGQPAASTIRAARLL